MRILVLCHEFPPLGGGSGNAAYEIGRGLCALPGTDAVVLTVRAAQDPSRESRGALDVERVRAPRARVEGSTPLELLVFAAAALRRALSLHREKPFDHVLAIHGTAAAWVARALYALKAVPYTVYLRGSDVPGFFPRMYAHMQRPVLGLIKNCWRNAAHVIANSDGLAALARKTGDGIGVSVGVVANGVDTELFCPAAGPRGTDASLEILSAGRITAQKGLDLLIDAMASQRAVLGERWTLRIIGEGESKKALQAQVEKLQMGSRVRFESWRDKASLVKAYQDAAVFALPSLEEGMPNAVLEALACGVPVLASRIPGIIELVTDGENGFLVEAGSLNSLEEGLGRLARLSPERLVEMGSAARARAEGRDWQAAAAALLALWKG